MKCHKCSAESKYKYIDKHLCKKCFVDLFEKTVRKNLRIGGSLKKTNRLVVVGPIAEWFIKKIVTMPCEKEYVAELSDESLQDKTVKIVLPVTLDDEDSEFLSKLFAKQLKKEEKDGRIIKLFRTIPEESVIDFCRLKEIPYTRKTNREKEMLDKLEKKYPGTKNSMLKSIDFIDDVM